MPALAIKMAQIIALDARIWSLPDAGPSGSREGFSGLGERRTTPFRNAEWVSAILRYDLAPYVGRGPNLPDLPLRGGREPPPTILSGFIVHYAASPAMNAGASD